MITSALSRSPEEETFWGEWRISYRSEVQPNNWGTGNVVGKGLSQALKSLPRLPGFAPELLCWAIIRALLHKDEYLSRDLADGTINYATLRVGLTEQSSLVVSQERHEDCSYPLVFATFYAPWRFRCSLLQHLEFWELLARHGLISHSSYDEFRIIQSIQK